MKRLNLPTYSFNIKSEQGGQQIFDESRKKWVALTPEEWVRQHLISYLVHALGYPVSLIATEMSIRINGQPRRCDIVIYNRAAEPVMIVECKSPDVPLSQAVFDQAARYNWHMQVSYLLITNGLKHYCARIDRERRVFSLLDHIPNYEELLSHSVRSS